VEVEQNWQGKVGMARFVKAARGTSAALHTNKMNSTVQGLRNAVLVLVRTVERSGNRQWATSHLSLHACCSKDGLATGRSTAVQDAVPCHIQEHKDN
jgi:hypothetical protein